MLGLYLCLDIQVIQSTKQSVNKTYILLGLLTLEDFCFAKEKAFAQLFPRNFPRLISKRLFDVHTNYRNGCDVCWDGGLNAPTTATAAMVVGMAH
jgi:hypothetical protein